MKKTMTMKQVEALVFYTLYSNTGKFIEDLCKWYGEQLEDEDYKEDHEFTLKLDYEALEITVPLFQLYFSEKALLQKYNKMKVAELLDYSMNKLPELIKALRESDGNNENYDISIFNHQKEEIYNLLKITESRTYANNAFSNVYYQMGKELLKSINTKREEVYDLELMKKALMYTMSCEETSLRLIKMLDKILIVAENQKKNNIFRRIMEKIKAPVKVPVKEKRYIYKFKNGDTYEGNFENKIMNGYGVFHNSSGDIYKGSWENNLKNGEGKYIFKTGETYEGSWKDDLRDGYGVNYFESGDIYKGEWTKGYRNGKGIYYFSDGRIFEGHYNMEVKEGYGKFTYPDGAYYEGEWENNSTEGIGIFRFPDGTIYKGEFHADMPDGKGIWEWPNGTSFEGNSYGYNPNGIGIFKDLKTGLSSVMIYENGAPKEIIENKCLNMDDIKLFFNKFEIFLKNDFEYELYKDFFNICITVINFKLDGAEMLEIYDFLSDVISGKKPEVVKVENSDDAIKIQYRLFEDLKQTKGKLNHQEKLLLAYCFFVSLFIRSIDEKTGELINDLGGLKSVKIVKDMYHQYEKLKPEMFDISDAELENEFKTFGYSKDNPIRCTSIEMEYQYIKRLRTEYGSPVRFVSQKLVGGMRDCMKVAYKYKGEEKFVELYFNGYSKNTTFRAPSGFLWI